MCQDGRARDLAGGGDGDLAGARAISPQTLLLDPFGNGLAEKSLASVRDGGLAGVVGAQGAPVRLKTVVQGGAVIHVQRRAKLARDRGQVQACDMERIVDDLCCIGEKSAPL